MFAVKWVGGVLSAVLIGVLVWGVGIEPRLLLDVRAYDAEVPNLPPAWENRTVALLADFQIGMWLGNTGMVEEALEEALDAQVALVLIAGDFLYLPDSAVVRKAVNLLRPVVRVGVPVVAVLGNHDYSLMKHTSTVRAAYARLLETELEAIGVRVLENEAVPVAPGNGDALYVVGLGSAWAGRSRPEQALAGLPADAPRLVLMHNPSAYRALPPNAGPLTMAAHTHGGQVRIPGTPSASWLDIALPGEVVADGWASDSIGAPGNRLYVSRGIGFSTVPLRIFCRPELTLFTLRRSGGTLPDREEGSAPGTG